jgi:hypothetical protein
MIFRRVRMANAVDATIGQLQFLGWLVSERIYLRCGPDVAKSLNKAV